MVNSFLSHDLRLKKRLKRGKKKNLFCSDTMKISMIKGKFCICFIHTLDVYIIHLGVNLNTIGDQSIIRIYHIDAKKKDKTLSLSSTIPITVGIKYMQIKLYFNINKELNIMIKEIKC